MWTGLGVIFIIGALAIPILKWAGILVFGGLASASERKKTQRKINKANEEKRRQEQLDKIQTMTSDYRRFRMAENPDTVVVGEKIETKRVWKDGQGWVFPYTIENRRFYWKRKWRILVTHKKYYTAEHGYTQSLYEYIEKLEFIDDIPEEQWQDENHRHNHKEYMNEREYQCRNYCETISMLVYRYVCWGDNTECRDEFIKLLMRNRELTLKFIRECHAANRWREQYSQVYDCKNYLQDFMKENEIQSKLTEQAGHEVQIPEDIRPYREGTPSKAAARHIQHELDKRGRVGKAEESEYKAEGWLTGVGIMTLICVVLIFIFFFGIEHGTDQSRLMVWLIIISGLVWMVVAFPAIGHQSDADKVKKAEQNDEYYLNPFPSEANSEGKEYAKGLAEKILSHPLPYKYYTNEE